VQSDITVILKSQHPIQVPKVKPNINLITDFTNKKNYYDNYTGGVLVMPRKYGGLCLPMNEAIAAGMPVIATDISPNNSWLPTSWLVPSIYRSMFKCKRNVDIYEADKHLLAQKIDAFCDPYFYNSAVDDALEMRESISWDALLPVYQKTFNDLME
jgi:glycosyltransferase involved in cell wall biosynthesis